MSALPVALTPTSLAPPFDPSVGTSVDRKIVTFIGMSVRAMSPEVRPELYGVALADRFLEGLGVIATAQVPRAFKAPNRAEALSFENALA